MNDVAYISPYWSIEDDEIIQNDGRVSAGFRVNSIEMESLTFEDYHSINTAFAQVLSNLPTGTIYQKIDDYDDLPFEGKDKLRTRNSGERKIVSHYYGRVATHHSSYIFLSFPREGEAKRSNGSNNFFTLKKMIGENPMQNIEQRKRQAEVILNEFQKSIEDLGYFTLERLSGDEFDESDDKDINELRTVYNQYLNADFLQPDPELDRGYYNGVNNLNIGSKTAAVISLIEQGNFYEHCVPNHYNVASPFTWALTNYYNEPVTTVVSIKIDDTEQLLKRMYNEKKISNIVSASGSKLRDKQHRDQAIVDFYDEIRSSGTKLVSFNYSAIVSDIDSNRLNKRISEVKKRMSDMSDGAKVREEGFDTASLFFALAPGNANQIPSRWITAKIDNAVAYNHFTTTYYPSNTGDYLADRNRNLHQVNIYNEALDSQHSITIGPTGSGKSFTTGYFVIQRKERSAVKQFIIDKGRTYYNMVNALGGETVEFDNDSAFEINPFYFKPNEGGLYYPGEDKIDYLFSLLQVMWKGPDKAITQAQIAFYVNTIDQYYQACNDRIEKGENCIPKLRGYYEFLKKHDQEQSENKEYQVNRTTADLDEFILALSPFAAENGRYAKAFNSERLKEVTDNDLVYFELDNVKDNKLLYPIITLIMIESVLELIRKYPNHIKYVYIDEAWSMLTDNMEKFIEYMFRTFRKHGGSINIITQGVNEILDCPVGPVFISNSDTLIVLNHKGKQKSLDLIKSAFSLTNHEMDLMNSLGSGKDNRELFVKQTGSMGKVYNCEPSTYHYPIITSKPSERNYFNQLLERLKNTEQAVNQYIEDRYV